MRDLEREEASLRSYLVFHPEDRTGAEHVAVLSSQSRKQLNIEALKREVGLAVIRRCTNAQDVLYVRLKERREDAA
jgi:hypothetical protein